MTKQIKLKEEDVNRKDNNLIQGKGKGKGKVHPLTDHEGPDVE